MNIINLFHPSTELILSAGNYDIFLTGGHSISIENGFQIIIRNLESQELVHLTLTTKFRSFENGQKAIKYCKFYLPNAGKYEVQIINPDRITIKKSMLISKNWFMPAPTNNEMNVLIKKR